MQWHPFFLAISLRPASSELRASGAAPSSTAFMNSTQSPGPWRKVMSG